jgi:hypothetical protein
MERMLTLEFEAEIVERQRLLNGAEYVSLEGRGSGPNENWRLALNYARAKESGAPAEEGDLTVEGPGGSLQAALESGRVDLVTDELGGDEQELLTLDLRFEDGDGEFSRAAGSARIRGKVVGSEAWLELTLELD